MPSTTISSPPASSLLRPVPTGSRAPAAAILHRNAPPGRRAPPPRPVAPSEDGSQGGDAGLRVGSRRLFVSLSAVALASSMARPAGAKTKIRSKYDEMRLLEQNRKIQRANNAPEDFPNFVREGFQVNVVTTDGYIKADSGLLFLDILVGKGDYPKDGQQVTFHYTGYNESGRRIDSTYLQGSPAKARLGNKTLVPGFEEGVKGMRPGGKRRIVIPPELGPPVGPSTFFSAKQYEIFDIELLSVKDCQRRTIGFYSDVVCD